VVSDSWRIADYLETSFPERPSLFGCEAGRGLARFVNAWVDRQIVPRVVPLLMIDLIPRVDEADGLHLRSHIEKAFRGTLEDLAARRGSEILVIRRLLDPARAALRSQDFLSGAAPAYADYALFSVFQWARIVSDFDLLETDDRVAAWRERMLDLFDGFARAGSSRDPVPKQESTR
jgi:glutathione S-transferase